MNRRGFIKFSLAFFAINSYSAFSKNFHREIYSNLNFENNEKCKKIVEKIKFSKNTFSKLQNSIKIEIINKSNYDLSGVNLYAIHSGAFSRVTSPSSGLNIFKYSRKEKLKQSKTSLEINNMDEYYLRANGEHVSNIDLVFERDGLYDIKRLTMNGVRKNPSKYPRATLMDLAFNMSNIKENHHVNDLHETISVII